MHPKSTMSRQQFVRVCDCGCGQPTLLSVLTRTARGEKAGQPQRYIDGHRQRLNRGQRRPGSSGRKRTQGGYILLLVPDHPFASKRGYVLEHRLVVEKRLGRYLHPDEVVHHRNRVKDDNRDENLEVMSHADHMRLHHGEDRARRWSSKYPACIVCGTTEVKHFGHGQCDRCYHRLYHHEIRVQDVTPVTLRRGPRPR